MGSELKKASVCISCLCLMLAGLAIPAAAEGQRESILERVQVIEDPELGELVRIALANLLETKEAARLYRAWRETGGPQREDYRKQYEAARTREQEKKPKVVRAITETYVQIKLLDTQIEQIDKKIVSGKTSEAIRAELILARAELEAKRMTKLAELREIMSIVPKHAFARKPVEALNSWLALDVIGDFVYMFNYRRPYYETYDYYDTEAVRLMPGEAAIEHIRDLIKEDHHLPLRVDIFRHESGLKLSEELHKDIIEVIKGAKAELEAEVYVRETHGGVDGSEYFVMQGKIYDSENNLRRDEPEDERRFFESSIPHLVGLPRRLPRKFIIKHDTESKDLAARMVEAIEAKAKELGVERFVEIEQEETEFEIPEEEARRGGGGRRASRR